MSSKMTIHLTEEGARFLLAKLELDKSYYSELVGRLDCSPANRGKWELVKELSDQLEQFAYRPAEL